MACRARESARCWQQGRVFRGNAEFVGEPLAELATELVEESVVELAAGLAEEW